MVAFLLPLRWRDGYGRPCMHCIDCGIALKTMCDQSDGLCSLCRSRRKDARKNVEAHYGRLSDFEDVDLVNELLRRGWVAGERIRRGRKQTTLRAPLDHERNSRC